MPLPPRPPPKKKKGPPEASEAQLADRARGTLLGLAVGDALGSTLRGKKLPSEQFPKLNEGVHTELRPGGPLGLKRGQVGDDTQAAVALAIGLRNIRRYDLVDTAKEYTRWMPHALELPVTTKAAFDLLLDGKHPEFTGKRVWLASNQRAADNGALARTVPLAVFFRWDATARILATLEDTAVTHFEPQCQLTAVILNAVIAAANTTPSERLDKVGALKAIEADLSNAAAQMGRLYPDWVVKVKDASEWLRADIRAAQDDDPMLYGPELHLHLNLSWVRVTLRLALWELWHAPSFESALIDVVNRGGDSDTNGAIVGALLGAVWGERAIPELWATPVLEVNGPGPLFSKYHPRELMTLAENLLPAPVAVVRPPAAPKKTASFSNDD